MTDIPASELRVRLRAAPKETMHPAYFAVAMATGIVFIACHLLGFAWLASGLFALNLLLYPSLVVGDRHLVDPDAGYPRTATQGTILFGNVDPRCPFPRLASRLHVKHDARSETALQARREHQ